MNRFKLNWKATESDAGKSLKEFLYERDISRTALTDIKFKGGNLLVNGISVTVRTSLKAGDQVDVYFPLEQSSETMKAENFPLEILFEDDYLLVVNKPAGMNSIPSREHPESSLANGLLGYYKKKEVYATTHIVTRLDRDTTGLVLVAKHRHIHHLMSKQQQENMVKRVYIALAEGIFIEKQGMIEKPIARKSDSIIEREVSGSGQYACTYYKVLNQFNDFGLIELRLKTGRTHQIRVHLSYLQHPLLGDDLYGGKIDRIKRQALHCREIQFIHPITKQEMKFDAPIPVDMMKILNSSKPC